MSMHSTDTLHTSVNPVGAPTLDDSHLRAIIRVLPDLALIIDEDGRCVEVLNPGYSLLYKKAEQVTGLLLHEIFSKSQADSFLAVITEAITTSDTQILEYTLNIDSIPRWFEARVSSIPVEHGTKPTVVWLARDISARKKAELAIKESQYYFENLDRISRAMSQASDTNSMLFRVVEEILAIFQVDRAWFAYPCDPTAPTWSIPVEATVPEHPGLFALKTEMPGDHSTARAFELALDSKDPVVFISSASMDHLENGALEMLAAGPSSEFNIVEFEELSETLSSFNIKSQIAIALRPKVGKPWLLGVHQCSHFRRWSNNEVKLFREIAERVTDCLTNFVLFRQLEADLIERKRSETRTQELLKQNRALTQRLFKIQEEERRYISQELHDEFGQLLTAINLHAQAIHRNKDISSKSMKDSALIVAEGTAEIIENIRNMIHHLRPASLDILGLKVTLQELIRQTQSQHNELEIKITFSGNLDNLGEQINIMLYRVIQEAITNVIKHAKAQQLSIRLIETSEPNTNRSVHLSIQDDGIGIDINQVQKGMGLTGMRERILAAGGEINFDLPENKGVLINAYIPISIPLNS